MATVNIPAGSTVTLDGGSDSTVEVTNTGAEPCVIKPWGVRVRPGQFIRLNVNPGQTIIAESRNGTTLATSISSTPDLQQIIDCGSAA